MAKRTHNVDLDFLQVETARPRVSGMFSASVTDLAQARNIPLADLADNPYQPRLAMDEQALQDLSRVIATQGFQGVLVARPHPENPQIFQLTAGHRRREAARRSGLSHLPVIVRDLSNEEMAAIAITENIQREDLTPLEEGKIFQMMAEEMGYTHEQIARDISKDRGYVENRLRVARAPQDIQDLVRAKPDSLRAVATLIKIKDPIKRAEAVALLKKGDLTADDLRDFLEPRQPLPVPAEIPAPVQHAGHPSATGETRSQMRIGQSKLASIQRTLDTYSQTLTERPEISPQERSTLTTIARSVLRLCQTYDIHPE